ncbi:hypothetical protein WMF45_23275 [Sorangium sp. So ce448]
MGDADITLRHIARRFPDDLACVFVPEDRSVEVLGWIDTQVTKLERRLDKALRLRVGAELRVLHVEFCFALRDDVPDQMFEYLGFLFSALRREAPGAPVPPIESVAVVLSGRRRRLPATGKRRTSWRGRRFSGTHFRVDVAYPFGDLHAVLRPKRCVKPCAGGVDGRKQKHLARSSDALAQERALSPRVRGAGGRQRRDALLLEPPTGDEAERVPAAPRRGEAAFIPPGGGSLPGGDGALLGRTA